MDQTKTIVESDDLEKLKTIDTSKWSIFLVVVNLYCYIQTESILCLFYALEVLQKNKISLNDEILIEGCLNKKYDIIKILLDETSVKWPTAALTYFAKTDNLEALSFAFYHGATFDKGILSTKIGPDCIQFVQENF